MRLEAPYVDEVVRRALQEDLGERGDWTTQLCVPEDVTAFGRILVREPGVVAGLDLVEACLRATDADVSIERRCPEGGRVEADQLVLRASGRAGALLAAERTALNFLQRMSGIATMARAFADAAGDSGLSIYDTRKTTPGLRTLEKYAVRVGGGRNHRFGLFDQVLIKENHFALAAPLPYLDVVRRAVEASDVPVVAEARTLAEAVTAVEGGAAVVMLDNFEPGDRLSRAVAHVREAAVAAGRTVEIEASGGINLSNVRAFAACGIDRVSVGALTHSVSALDVSMLIEVDA